MPIVNVWSKVGVAVQSALAAPKTITAITKANPAVASSTAHGFTNGNVVLLKISGMRQLDYVIARVANITANTFDIEGYNSTLFDTFTSGTAELVTFGAIASTFQEVTASGGESAGIPVTTIHDDQDYEIPGNRSPLSFAFSSLWDVSDPALIALKNFDDAKGSACILISFATGAKVYMNAYPSAGLQPNGSSGQAVTTPVTLRLRGRLTNYAT